MDAIALTLDDDYLNLQHYEALRRGDWIEAARTYFIGANIKWDMGFTILLLLFAGVTLGGLGSAFGALVGAVFIGIVTELSTLFIAPDLRYAVALLVLILVLLFRPQGILGRRERIG